MISIRQQARDLGVHPSTVMRRLKSGRTANGGKGPMASMNYPKRGPGIEAVTLRAKAVIKELQALLVDMEARQEIIQQIANGAREGRSQQEIADEIGCSRVKVQRLKRRYDIMTSRHRPVKTAREQVSEMKPIDAVEHLAYLTDEITATVGEQLDIMQRMGLTSQQAILYATLEKSTGRLVTSGALAASCSTKYDEPLCIKHVNVLVTKVRKKLPPGEEIRNVWGQGYYLHRKDQTREH